MRRKYLDDIGVTDRHDTWAEDERQERFKEQREKYGFDERETWSLDHAFHCWLYERLMMFLEVNNIDLEFHKFRNLVISASRYMVVNHEQEYR